MNRSLAVAGLIVLSAFGAGIVASMYLNRPAPISSATVFPQPRPLPAVSLSDHNGGIVSADRFLAGWDILFFGFTHCPDICPTTLYELGQLRKLLADLEPARQPRIWLVSVDPERDTPTVLADYLANFGAAFSGITGDPDQIAALAAPLGVSYRRLPEGDDYTMAHTAALFLIDDAANLVALFSAPHDIARIADDYRVLTQ